MPLSVDDGEDVGVVSVEVLGVGFSSAKSRRLGWSSSPRGSKGWNSGSVEGFH